MRNTRLVTDANGVRHKAEPNVNWRGSNFSDSDLIGVNLRNANLADVNLQGANLTRANLSGANLRGADLSQARLMGADMSGAELDGAVLAFNVWDEDTKWPEGFKPFAWQREEENEEEGEDLEPFADPMTEDEIDQCKSYVRKNIKDGHWALAEMHASAVSRDTVLKYDAEIYDLIAQKAKQIRELIKEISALSVQ